MLKSPCAGRVEYRLVEPGEVIPAGGKVVTLLDLLDVYMTFFLPTDEAGKVPIGADARIVLDALPEAPIRRRSRLFHRSRSSRRRKSRRAASARS